MSNEYIIIPKSERDIAKGAIVFTEVDLEKVLANRDSFIKFLEKSIHKYKSDHGQLLDVGKEAETYIAINTIQGLIKSLESTFTNYKEMKLKEKE